jgi:hypothetical protein
MWAKLFWKTVGVSPNMSLSKKLYNILIGFFASHSKITNGMEEKILLNLFLQFKFSNYFNIQQNS